MLTNLASVPQLEALLLLRASPGERWDSDRVAARLYMPPSEIEPLLSRLVETGVLDVDIEAGKPAWRYAPRTPVLAALCGRIEDAYARNLVSISRLIHSKGDRAAQRFADAFKWRKG
ncbi:MAG TPA: hypothetical protein VND91_10610 [Candidatus Saccharimonadia bacterium]|nr:hypothetical protein [Candidatus Saccharimonadia bacterium]